MQHHAPMLPVLKAVIHKDSSVDSALPIESKCPWTSGVKPFIWTKSCKTWVWNFEIQQFKVAESVECPFWVYKNWIAGRVRQWSSAICWIRWSWWSFADVLGLFAWSLSDLISEILLYALCTCWSCFCFWNLWVQMCEIVRLSPGLGDVVLD